MPEGGRNRSVLARFSQACTAGARPRGGASKRPCRSNSSP